MEEGSFGMDIGLYSVEEIDRQLKEVDIREAEEITKLIAVAQEPIPDDLQWLEEGKRNAILGWGQSASIFPMSFGLACCAFEMMSCVFPRFDQARFGMEGLRPTPRQCDLLLISGTVTWKMAPVVRRIYDQMADPKWVIAMGACATSGGTFASSYSVVPGVNRILPVDVYVPGCPPRPEAVLNSFLELKKKIKGEHP